MVVSLSLAVVLLNVLVTFLSGFDMDKYLSQRSCADFIVSTPDYFNYSAKQVKEFDDSYDPEQYKNLTKLADVNVSDTSSAFACLVDEQGHV